MLISISIKQISGRWNSSTEMVIYAGSVDGSEIWQSTERMHQSINNDRYMRWAIKLN